MQWLFSFITVVNFSSIIVVLSYVGSRFLPWPDYSEIFLRLVLFIGIALVFRYVIGPTYRQVLAHWPVFIYVTVAIMLNFLFYTLASDDILQSITNQATHLLSLIALIVAVYAAIIHALKTISREYALREEKLKVESRQELLQSELAAQEEFIKLARHNRHDLRYHNALLADYLERGDIDGAKGYLRQHNAHIVEATLKQFCKNHVANAVLRIYERRAEQNNIALAVSADIPERLPLTAPETGELFSNLLENACEACERTAGPGRFITLNAQLAEGRLLLELSNKVSGETTFNKNGMPLSRKTNGGTGTRSMVQIVQKYGGMLHFEQTDGTFFTQIILPVNQVQSAG